MVNKQLEGEANDNNKSFEKSVWTFCLISYCVNSQLKERSERLFILIIPNQIMYKSDKGGSK